MPLEDFAQDQVPEESKNAMPISQPGSLFSLIIYKLLIFQAAAIIIIGLDIFLEFKCRDPFTGYYTYAQPLAWLFISIVTLMIVCIIGAILIGRKTTNLARKQSFLGGLILGIMVVITYYLSYGFSLGFNTRPVFILILLGIAGFCGLVSFISSLFQNYRGFIPKVNLQ